jgi:LysW-gamma-L-lysine carboxypeptidase
VEAVAELWQAIRRRHSPEAGRSLFDQVTPTLISVHGDMRDACMVVSCRIPVGFDIDAFERWLREAAGDDEVTVLERTPAVRRPRTDPVARALSAAIRREGLVPSIKVKLGYRGHERRRGCLAGPDRGLRSGGFAIGPQRR